MGLDQYLYKKVWVNRTRKNNVADIADKNIEIFDEEYPLKDLEYLVYEVGYWRKCNQVHKWFVDNVQAGKDDCGEYYVDHALIKDLYKICKKIQEDPKKAEDLLPSYPGFFFGTYDYDEYYMKDIQHTIDILEPLLKDKDNASFYYSSSW